MKLIIEKSKLKSILIRQLSNILYYNHKLDYSYVLIGIDKALERVEYCFSHIKNKYYVENGEVKFNIFHSGQSCIFLYYLSNSIWHLGNQGLAERIYLLNKIINSVDIFYEVEMPPIFACDHPVGSVMGRANYSDYFFFMQGCVVGNNHGKYPIIGEKTIMCANSKILGSCIIEGNSIIGVDTTLISYNVEKMSVVKVINGSIDIKHKDINDNYIYKTWWGDTK